MSGQEPVNQPSAASRHGGGCLCGGVRFEVEGPLAGIEICHCQQCRRAQGSAFAAMIPVERARFHLVAGADLLQAYRSSPGKLRHFCRVCGSPVMSTRDSLPDRLRLRAGLFDDDLPVGPVVHQQVAAICNWWPITDDLPCHAAGLPGTATGPTR